MRDLLCIERNANGASVERMLREVGYSFFAAETGREGREILAKHQVTYGVILNAHSQRTKGNRICRDLRRGHPKLPVLIITAGAKPAPATLRLEPGFTDRKLINRVERYAPVVEQDCLRCGRVVLDMARDRVIVDGRPRPLPGNLHDLLAYFLEH